MRNIHVNILQLLFSFLIFHAGTIDECVTLPSLLSFFTGADTVPPTGYSSVTLNFNHENMYPTASTCAIELTLPTKHKDYETFRSHTITALTMHGGFGLI